MEFCGFVEKLKSEVEKMCEEIQKVEIQRITGNNGIIHTAMNITERGGKVSPVVHLNSYYENYKEGHMSVKRAAEEIYAIFKNYEIPSFVNAALDDFESIKNKVVYQLVDYSRNIDMLKDMPHICYCDLAVVFYLILENNESGQATVMIHNKHIKVWHVDVNTLYELAGINTPKLLPANIKSMAEVMKEIAKEHMGNEWGNAFFEGLLDDPKFLPQYVLTNCQGIKGAAAVLYKGVLKTFADKIGSDLFILPSSVHEVILVPYEDSMNVIELEAIVKAINLSEVPDEDVLSDHVYLYNRKTDQVIIVFGESIEGEGGLGY